MLCMWLSMPVITVILHAHSDHAAVRVGKGDQMNRQRFLSMRALFSVKERRFHCTADLCSSPCDSMPTPLVIRKIQTVLLAVFAE